MLIALIYIINYNYVKAIGYNCKLIFFMLKGNTLLFPNSKRQIGLVGMLIGCGEIIGKRLKVVVCYFDILQQS